MIETRRFTPLLTAVALVVLFHQVTDLAWMLPGVDFTTPAGRARQAIALEARSPGLLAADLMLIWALAAGRSQRPLRWVAGAHFAAGVALLLLCPLFLNDAGQLASGFGGAQSVAFRVVVARTLVMFLLLGVGALLAARALLALSREVEIPV